MPNVSPAYQSQPDPPLQAEPIAPSSPLCNTPTDLPLAIRRHTDRCFFAVEEIVHHADGSLHGYIVDGILIDADDIAELRNSPKPSAVSNQPVNNQADS